MSEKTIMTAEDIRRSLARIAHEIIERNKTAASLVVVGMHTRGVPLAGRLAAKLGSLGGVKVPLGALDIGPYRDDLGSLNPPPSARRTDIPTSIDGKRVILVDDVLYTGRSIRAAMDALMDRGRPQSVQLVVLVDRGHRELPVRADYVGKNIPSARHENIKVRLVETDDTEGVFITDGGQELTLPEGRAGSLSRKELS